MIEPVTDAQSLKRQNAGWQYALAAGLVGGEIAPLEHDDRMALLRCHDRDGQSCRTSADNSEVP